uniref:Protein tyrosine phosphatase receptor type N2 n=1 Tax=Echeneis naucrates TaxID=173247 RepID=A0A665X5F5_ECHNA
MAAHTTNTLGNLFGVFLTVHHYEPVFIIFLSSCPVDGVFGRCRELAGADLYTYDISSPVLQRLRILLQKLAHRGLTWQDDITQQVISRELSKLRNIPLRHQATPPSPPDRLTAYSSSTDPSRSKPQQGWKETTVYSVQKGAGQPPLTKVFSQSGEGRHPKLSASLANRDPGRSMLLSSHIERLLGGAPGTQVDAPGKEASQPKGKLSYLSYIRPSPSEHAKLQSQAAFGSKTQRPNLDRLLLKAGSNGVTAKEPLSIMDEHFIQDVVDQLGRHSFNMEAFMGNDLDQLAEVITGALQEVDEKRPTVVTQPGRGAADFGGHMEGNREPLAAMQLNQHQDLKSAKGQDPKQKDSLKIKPEGGCHAAFFSKLLDYLNLEPFGDAPEGNSRPPAALQKMVGLETVQSRTKQGQVPVPHHWEDKSVATSPKEGSTLQLAGGAEGPDPQVDSEIDRLMQGSQVPAGKKELGEPQKKDMRVKTQLVHVGVKDSLTTDQGLDLMERLMQRLNLHAADLTQLSVLGPALTFRVGSNSRNVSTADLVEVAGKSDLYFFLITLDDSRGSLTQIPVVKETRVESGQFLLLSVLCMLFILVALAVSATFFCVRQRSHLHMKEKLASLGTDTSTDATATYQELCRQRMAIRTSERVERPETLRHSRLNSVSSQFSDGPAASPSTRSSTSSWCEEPVPSNMDISTGHMILSYMEDHLKNKNRLEREWEALCSYQAEPGACSVGQGEQNSKRNRSDAVVVYDHSRITLKAENNHGNSDYINASPIMDHDPRNPTYIASQGPLPSTVADLWQMVWESGCVVIVMLTPLSENGVKQCHHYWPDEGSDVYHIYEVNLVSEHIWCEDFLVRSFYLKNLQTNETRTVTQFHFLSWMDRGIPTSARTLLDFRRKVNKCYRGRSCPIIVHCSDGAGRSGTYILIDMVLNRMAKGAKEIDIAATLEHLRDQRAGMVQTKEQFEFALTAVAEEVNAILKALPQ